MNFNRVFYIVLVNSIKICYNHISRTGTSEIIFGYNGRDGVVTDKNGLIYMRARYYSPEMRRFVNADIVAGEISNAVTLNRYAYANGNPVSKVDPFGLSADTGTETSINYYKAVLVSDKRWKSGLPIFGHTYLLETILKMVQNIFGIK